MSRKQMERLFETILSKLISSEDVIVYYDSKRVITWVTFRDFKGFDSEWSEISRQYNDFESVTILNQLIYEMCLDKKAFYREVRINKKTYKIDYASYDA